MEFFSSLAEEGVQPKVHDDNTNMVDIDEDGFVDEITNYQMWISSGGVDLTNRRGRTYSDNTSRKWDAIKAVESDAGFSVLVEGHLSKEGKYKVVSADDEGVISRATRWLNGNQMQDSGYERIFSMDFNGNGVVDLV
jgi:serralysin